MDSDLKINISDNKATPRSVNETATVVNSDKSITTITVFYGQDKNGNNVDYLAAPNGRLAFYDEKAKTCTIWDDTDKNGKYDTMKVMSIDDSLSKRDVLSINKLDESQNDIKNVQEKLLAKLKQEDNEYNLSKINLDGKIGDFEQNKFITGDCWLLGGLKSLSLTENGIKAISDSISQDDDGNITVTLKGVNESYTFAPRELNSAKSKLSSGDDDTIAIELAVQQHRMKVLSSGDYDADKNLPNQNLDKRIGNDAANPLNGGRPDELFYLLTGKKMNYYIPKIGVMSKEVDKKELIALNMDDDLNNGLALKADEPDRYAVAVSFKETKGLMVEDHIYAIKSASESFVVLVNPWDTTKEIKIHYNDFVDNCSMITLCDMKD